MLYFDTSFLVPIILPEASSSKISTFMERLRVEDCVTSQWTRIEFSSMLAREVRISALDTGAAHDADNEFDALLRESFNVLLPTGHDFHRAREYLQQFDTNLRAGDALHLAIASNRGAQAIYSLDKGLLEAGRILGLPATTGVRLGGY